MKDIIENIYKIFDAGDSNYSAWYGTADAIANYLEEHKDNYHGYDKNDGWVKNLERYGLTFEIIDVYTE